MINEQNHFHRSSNNEQTSQRLISWLEMNFTQTLPFVFILIIKLFHQHSTGLSIYLFSLITIHHGNRLLRGKHPNKNNLIGYLLILIFSIYLLIKINKEEKIFKLFYFHSIDLIIDDVFTLFWINVSAFSLVKLISILIKVLIKCFSSCLFVQSLILNNRRISIILSLIEKFSEFYLSLILIRPWILFLIDGSRFDLYFNRFLVIVYLIVKMIDICKRSKSFYRLIKQIYSTDDKSNISIEQIQSKTCSICENDLIDGLSLRCQDVFCRHCILPWIDQHGFCPICRMKLVERENSRPDGSTSIDFIWF